VRRAIQVALVERLTHQRTAHPLAIEQELPDLLHREAVHGPAARSVSIVPSRRRAK